MKDVNNEALTHMEKRGRQLYEIQIIWEAYVHEMELSACLAGQLTSSINVIPNWPNIYNYG